MSQLPRYWKKKIRELTGLQFCDKNCGCGENNQKWWFPPGQYSMYLPKWVPGWMNGVDSDEIWDWLVKNGRDRKTS